MPNPISNVLSAIRWRLRSLYAKRYYYFRKLVKQRLPEHSLSYLPDGFNITKLGDTGVAIIDNFCSADEAKEIIEIARPQLGAARIMEDGVFIDHPERQCETALVFGPNNRDSKMLNIACRAAALVGLPYTYMEGVYVTRYLEGGFYNEHFDFGNHFRVDRLYTVLLYLNDMTPEQGGTTVFPNLNIEAQPMAGRAVSWVNMNPDGSHHPETSHAALPVAAGAEKWAIQFWFHPHKMFNALNTQPPQKRTGQPVAQNDQLPAGASYFVKDTK
jgi:hypothetical protein